MKLLPARKPRSVTGQPGRDFSLPGTNCSQPGSNPVIWENSGGGSWMHMLYSSHYAPDTWLLTSRIMNPPWVLGLPGLPWALPGFPWAFPLAPGPGPRGRKNHSTTIQPIQQFKKPLTASMIRQTEGTLGPFTLSLDRYKDYRSALSQT